jgi:RND family efflux transporter MFP subunit
MTRTLTRSVVLAALTAGLLSSCGGRGGPPEGARTQAVPVEVHAVDVGSVTATVAATGTIVARDDVLVSAEANGQVKEIPVKVGQRVEKGQTLVMLDEELAELGVKQAEAQLLLAEADLANAEANLKRAKTLWESGDIPDADFESTERLAKVARAGYMVAEAGLGTARRQLRNARITSPIAGFVAFVHAEEGQLVGLGTPVAHVVNDSWLEIELGLNEDQVVEVRPGRSAEVRVRAYPDDNFEGNIEYVGPRAEDLSKTYPVRVVLRNEDRRLRGGMVAEVTIATADIEDVVVIERDWVVERFGEPAVFVAADTLAQLRKVALGKVVGARVVVESGLERGDLVVSLGYDQLSDGTRIDVKNLPRRAAGTETTVDPIGALEKQGALFDDDR